MDALDTRRRFGFGLVCGLLVGVLLSGLSITAQETYSVGPTTAQQVIDLTDIIVAANQRTCIRLNAAGSPACSQAQACTAANATGGASCTAAQARAASARIWPNANQTDRAEYVTFVYASEGFKRERAQVANSRQHDIAVAAWAVASVANRNAVCTATAIGLSNGCDFLTLQ